VSESTIYLQKEHDGVSSSFGSTSLFVFGIKGGGKHSASKASRILHQEDVW
jgi:hypothetical protein